MMSKTKWLSIVLSLCLIVSGIMVVSATGETAPLAAEAEKNGIQVSLTTDKDTYAAGEAIYVVLRVGNSTSENIANVQTQISLPSTLSVALGTLTKTYEELGAAQLGQNKLYIGLGQVELPPDVDISDGTGEGNGDGVEANPDDGGDNTDNAPAEEEAPDNTVLLIVAVVVLVGSAGGLIFLFATGKIKLKKTFVLLLLVGIMLISLIPAVEAEETSDEKKLEVATTITVDGQEMTISATVTWEEGKPYEITRGMAEEAFSAFLWAYYAKGFWCQYESTGPSTAVSYAFGGFSPMGNQLTTIEDATEHTNSYTVCSNYAWQAYWQVMGMPIFGDAVNAGSEFLWYYVETSVANDHVDDLCVMRWHTYHCDHEMQAEAYMLHEKCISKGPLEEYREPYEYEEYVTYTIDIEPLKEWFRNWEENLRPGDIIRLPGHIATYAGDGWILDSGAGKYVKDYGGYNANDPSLNITATTVENYFLPDGKNTIFRLEKFASGGYSRPYSKNGEQEGIAVIRPLDSIFMDDGDGDPSNDPLNPDYYHYGVDCLNWQVEEYDKTDLPHSGYTIQPAQFTRIKYPMMNINRTVSVGPYGHAAKGETFTYSVEIINQSNNLQYITTREEGYNGETFVDVPIVETLPEGVELVSTNATAVIGNKLYWLVDVGAGKSYDCYYEVRATEEMGYEIVNDGGFVGHIPSNRLVTTIGGKYLTEETVSKFIAFYEDGKDKWNSNDGYKLTANVNQDAGVFAEQIYKLAGINLDMPDMNSLLRMLLKQEYIKVEGGLYGQKNKSIETWMHTLIPATTNSADQVWHDMIMNGAFYGGYYMWTNEYSEETRRVDLPFVRYFKPGDFVICMDLVNGGAEGGDAYVAKSWKTIFCIDYGKFVSLDSNGVLAADDTWREVESIFTFDMFFGFCPTQAYEDIYTDLGAYTGSFANLTAADIAYKGDITPSEVKLDDKFKEKLNAISARDLAELYTASTELAVPIIGNIYDYIGVDVKTNALSGHTWDSLVKVLFDHVYIPTYDKTGWHNAWHNDYYLREEPMKGYETLRKMLMYYDGDLFEDNDGKNVPLTSIDDLEIGDAIIFGGKGGTTTVMTYQGVKRNKYSFIATSYSPIGGYYLGNWASIMGFRDNADFIDYLNGPVTDKNGDLQQGGTLFYGGYLVLRPARGFDDINRRAIRDLGEGMLTDYEKQLLSNLQEGNVGSHRIQHFIEWAYGQAYIKVSNQFDLTDDKMYYWKCFPSGGNVTTNFEHPVAQMLVNKSWSGNGSGTSSPKKNYGLTESWNQWQIGDVVYGRHKPAGSNVYFAAVYMGNGRFMEKELKTGVIRTYKTPEEFYNSRNWEHILVYRPDQLFTGATAAPRPTIKEKTLTADEKKVIASLKADYSKIGGNQLDDTVAYVYNAVDIDLTKYFTRSANNTYYALFSSKGVMSKVTLENVNYHRMLVDKSWGGSWFANNGKETYALALKDLQIGDIVVLRGTNYWYAVYQGNGKFLIGKSNKSAETRVFNDTDNTIYAADNWDYYFVLRPDRLGIKDEYGYLDPIQFGSAETTKGGRELTKEEQDIIKALTPEECGTERYNSSFAPWIYGKINVNLSDIGNSVSGTLNRVVGQGTSANPIELKTESDYYPLLVDKSWGGTNVAPVIGQYFLAQKDFKIGDILMIYTTKTETGTNAYWQALYQGDGKFLVEVYGSATVMYYDQVKNIVNGGTFTKADGTSTATIMAAKSYAVIRFSNILGGKPAKVPETITDTVEREESPVAVTGRELTEAEQAVIKALTAEQLGDKNYNLKNFAPWVYKAINMDSYVTTFLNGDSNANALNALFNAKSPHVLNEASKYNYVLVPNSYGGTSIKNSVGNFVLPVAEYKIGDILITRASYTKPAADDPTASSSTYWSAVYQGDGKFLVETYAGAPIVMTYDELMAIGLNGGTYGDKLLTPWGMYAVLRFSYILPEPTTPPDGPGGEGGETPEDPEDPENPENPEEPETPTAPGRALTEAEKAAIAAINKDSFAVSADWGVLSTGIFATIGVEYTSELDIWSVFTTLFTQDVSNDSSEGVKDVGAPLDRAAVAEEYRTTWDMIVANSWGGSWFNKNYRNTLTADDFQIGDILVARSSTSPYWMFLYIGNDQFVAWCGSGKSYRGTTTMDLLLNSFLAGDGFKYTPGTNVDAETGLDKVIATGAVRHYCIMRVGQILEPLEETPATVGRELTEEEKEILSAVTADTKYTGNWESVVAVFNKIGFDCPNTATTSDIMSLFDGEAKAKTTLKERDTVAEELLYTYDMIVENGWGGAWFAKDNRNTLTPDSFQIGDILYIRTSDIAYWFLFYTGDNTFVAWNSTNRTNTGTVSMDAVLDLWLQNKAFTYDLEGVETTKTPGTVRQYCILRVSQILEPLDEASVPRDVMEKKLTAEEKAAIAAIQSTDDFGGQGTMAFINWVYAQANIDASSFNTRNGRAYYDNLFAGRKPNTEESLYPVYVDQSYGGTYPVGTTNGGYRLDEFIIGDIFFGRYTNEADTNIYLTAFYQGNGNFLVCEGYESSSGITSTSSSAATVMNFDDPTTTDVVETIYDYQIWYFYYTLNFDQVAGTANN